MNKNFDHAVLKPTAEAYVAVVPEPARDGVHNVLINLNSPCTFANDFLQGEMDLAGRDAGTIRAQLHASGSAAWSIVATPAGIPGHSSDFGQTLGVWGVGPIPYLVVPLLGPTNPARLDRLCRRKFRRSAELCRYSRPTPTGRSDAAA